MNSATVQKAYHVMKSQMNCLHRLSATLLLSASACSFRSGVNTTAVTSAEFVNRGVVMEVDDSRSTKLSAGVFTPSFSSQLLADPSAFPYRDLGSKWDLALQKGAKRVRLYSGSDTLHGVLALNELPVGTSGAGSQSYRIEIPRQLLEAAKQGRIVHVYELVPAKVGFTVLPAVLGSVVAVGILGESSGIASAMGAAAFAVGGLATTAILRTERDVPSWVLWISRTPFD